MVYVAGFLGFLGGFIVGQLILLALLKNRPEKDLIEDKSIHWTYGVLNWVIAGIGAYSFIFLYQQYFSS